MVDVNIDNEKLLDLIAQKALDQYVDYDNISERVTKAITDRLNLVFKNNIEDRIETLLNDALQKVLDTEVQPVNIWGEKVGEATSIREQLSEKAKEFWNTKVDTYGKPKTDYYGSSKTRAEFMIGQLVSEEFMKQVKANSVGILTELKEKLRIDAHKLIDAHMDNLIKVK